MSTRNVRDVIIAGFEGVLRDEDCHPGKVRAIALKLAAVVEGHGVTLSRPAHLHDPVADDWRGRSRPEPGDAATGRAAASAALAAHRKALAANQPAALPPAALPADEAERS